MQKRLCCNVLRKKTSCGDGKQPQHSVKVTLVGYKNITCNGPLQTPTCNLQGTTRKAMRAIGPACQWQGAGCARTVREPDGQACRRCLLLRRGDAVVVV